MGLAEMHVGSPSNRIDEMVTLQLSVSLRLDFRRCFLAIVGPPQAILFRRGLQTAPPPRALPRERPATRPATENDGPEGL